METTKNTPKNKPNVQVGKYVMVYCHKDKRNRACECAGEAVFNNEQGIWVMSILFPENKYGAATYKEYKKDSFRWETN